MKKNSGFGDFSNFQEFLLKAKGECEDQAFVTFQISVQGQQDVVEEQQELVEENETANIKTENGIFGFIRDLPRKKTGKNENFRFGLAPLEAIEENVNEDLFVSKDCGVINPQVSQPNSPRLEYKYAMTLKGRKLRLLSEERAKCKRNSIKKTVKSPYSESLQISPTRLPAIKRDEKVLGMLKSFSLVKKRGN